MRSSSDDFQNFLDTHYGGAVVTHKGFDSAGYSPEDSYFDKVEQGIDVRIEIHPTNVRDISDLAFGVHFKETIGKGPNFKQESLFMAGSKFEVLRAFPQEENGSNYLQFHSATNSISSLVWHQTGQPAISGCQIVNFRVFNITLKNGVRFNFSSKGYVFVRIIFDDSIDDKISFTVVPTADRRLISQFTDYETGYLIVKEMEENDSSSKLFYTIY